MATRTSCVSVALVTLGMASASLAAFIQPTGWARPVDDASASASLTTFQEWNVFTSVAGPNAPDVAEINPTGVANAFDSNAGLPPAGSGAFITSGGNIYSPSGMVKPRIVVPQPNAGGTFFTEVLFQVKVLGNEIATNDLTVDGIPINTLGNYVYAELSRLSLGGFGGFSIEHLWGFTLPGNASSFTVDIPNGASSVSLDRVSVDTFAVVPEPTGVFALALGALALVRRR